MREMMSRHNENVINGTTSEEIDSTISEDIVHGPSDGAESRERERGGAQSRSQRKNPEYWKAKCLERKKKWTCQDQPSWQAYAKLYAEKEEKLEDEDKFKRRKAAYIPRFPRVHSVQELTRHHNYFPLGAFHQEKKTQLPNKLKRDEKIRLWRNMRTISQVNMSDVGIGRKVTVDMMDKGIWPCSSRDIIGELKERLRNQRKKRTDLFPCDKDETEEKTFYDVKEDYAKYKELGHARIPPSCPEPKKDLLVDRPVGENPGLVDGDYLLFELASTGNGERVYADVCLRGLKGMHLPELGPLRKRRKTWKFCFYQAIVALLAKTQLRYKYAWSANIDYIYDHAWMLFVHMGSINIKNTQRLDDVVVYNYKYSVELELVQESMDVPVVENVGWDYTEPGFKRQIMLRRKELMDAKLGLGWEKITDRRDAPVHEEVKQIEEWLDKLPLRFRNCIFRTTRFSLAFWQDGHFWYLYNPYRCDEFGSWNDSGYACIVKFCSRESLKRHLMILLLRAYAYPVPSPTQTLPAQSDVPSPVSEQSIEGEGEVKQEPTGQDELDVAREEDLGENDGQLEDDLHKKIGPDEEKPDDVEKFYTVQIFNMVYQCCQVHNLKVLQRGSPRPAVQGVKRKVIDDCPFDPLDLRDPCEIEMEENDLKEAIEKATWLKLYSATWARCPPPSRKANEDNNHDNKELPTAGKMRWHRYLVEESNKLFSLWGELHITDGVFEKENRGLQTYACYVVCAGMTRITAPEYWTSKTLDAIVMCGDRYYAHSKLEAEFKSTKPEYGHVACWDKYLTSHFKIGETMFEAKVLPAICGRLYARSGKSLWRSIEQMFLRYHFAILTCESSCLGIFKFCGAYYMHDVNSYGPPLFPYGEGSSYVLRATYFNKFMNVLIISIGSPECSRFALNPIEILKVIDVGSENFPIMRRTAREKNGRAKKLDCPYNEEKKMKMKMNKLSEKSVAMS